MRNRRSEIGVLSAVAHPSSMAMEILQMRMRRFFKKAPPPPRKAASNACCVTRRNTQTGIKTPDQDAGGHSQGCGGADRGKSDKDPRRGVELHPHHPPAKPHPEGRGPDNPRAEDAWEHPGPSGRRESVPSSGLGGAKEDGHRRGALGVSPVPGAPIARDGTLLLVPGQGVHDRPKVEELRQDPVPSRSPSERKRRRRRRHKREGQRSRSQRECRVTRRPPRRATQSERRGGTSVTTCSRPLHPLGRRVV